MNNQPEIQQFELLWLQAIPSISAIYYHKYLSETHVLHYLDDPHNDSQVTPRSIGKEIHKVIQSVSLYDHCFSRSLISLILLLEREASSNMLLEALFSSST
jgi:hypothetical protein